MHNGLGPSASVINQENASQACLQNTLVNRGFLFLNDCFYQLLEKHNVDGFILEYIAFFLQFLKVRLGLIDSLD